MQNAATGRENRDCVAPVPLDRDQLRKMDGMPVVVVTQGGVAVSVGTIRTSEGEFDEAMLRLDVHFETETMRCVLRVPLARVQELASSFQADMYRYVLPAGDQVWLPNKRAPLAEPAPTEAVVMSFPLPPSPVVKPIAPISPPARPVVPAAKTPATAPTH